MIESSVRGLYAFCMNFSELGATGIITIVIVAFAVLGFVKGILKLVYSLLCLVGTFTAAWLGHTWGFQRVLEKWPSAPENTQIFCAVVAALLAFMILRAFAKFLSNPFPSGKDQDGKKSGVGLVGLLVGVTLSFAACWFGIQQLIHQGSKAEIDYWLAQAQEKAPEKLPYMSQLKQTFTQSSLGKRIAQVFPLNDPVDQTLAKLTVMRITSTGHFQKLAEHPTIQQTLLDPKVLHFMMNKDVVASIESGDTDAILANPEFQDLITDPELKDAIAEIDIEQALELR